MKLISSIVITSFAVAACDSSEDGETTTTAAAYCASEFRADVRTGPNAGAFLEGTLVIMERPAGGIAAFLAHEGQVGDEPMLVPASLADGMVSLAFTLPQGTINGSGPWDGDLDNCPEELVGDLTGPAEGDAGDWVGTPCVYSLSACVALVVTAAKATCFAGCSYAGNSDAKCNQSCGTNN